ncbi:uncharacterized protein EI97DRAFT_96557 [Westerdykella ornata]|uniref:Uncharacterized protein n=1 Tax=Westerdykella ornata TaxID=318751 RepID=A0A6A6JEI5_WESOR|nr:uncharacterized protein EI97DRAFT_96557 [Westerdykella ornata]KAF2274675.1 hypothetical protein EI97DRAFT_96557 [Westerdykella ornata]
MMQRREFGISRLEFSMTKWTPALLAWLCVCFRCSLRDRQRVCVLRRRRFRGRHCLLGGPPPFQIPHAHGRRSHTQQPHSKEPPNRNSFSSFGAYTPRFLGASIAFSLRSGPSTHLLRSKLSWFIDCESPLLHHSL